MQHNLISVLYSHLYCKLTCIVAIFQKAMLSRYPEEDSPVIGSKFELYWRQGEVGGDPRFVNDRHALEHDMHGAMRPTGEYVNRCSGGNAAEGETNARTRAKGCTHVVGAHEPNRNFHYLT